MNYNEFITEIKKYWNLRDKGLKKQTNKFLFDFTKRFKNDVSESDADKILFQFCHEYIDELKFPLPPHTDQMTVELYFNEQIEFLYWGQHHFPEGCIITHEEYENTVKTAKKILCEKSVSPSLVDEFEYYVNLYQIYFEWHNNGRNGDFYEICKVRGLEYKATYTYRFSL